MPLKMRVDVYESLPPGQYTARLRERKEMPASQKFPDAGPSFAWEFEVVAGEHAGKSASAWTPTRLTSQNNLGKLISRMLGRPMRSGEEIDLDDFMGKIYSIIVDTTQDGTRTKVISAQPVSPTIAAAVMNAISTMAHQQPVPASTGTPAPASIPAPPPRQAAPAPVAPPPPADKVFAGTRDDFKNLNYWTYASISGAEGVEMRIGDLRKMVSNGMVQTSDVSVYLVADGAWTPLSVVDLPF